MNPRWRDAAAIAFLLALTIGVFWQLTFSDQYTWLENPDQALQVRPWLDYESRELHHGRLPLWDPYLIGGQSLIAQVQPGLVNPFNWILFAMPLRDGHIPLGVLHWYWVLIHFVAAAFCYWLCCDLGAGVWPSIVGASIFAFAGFIGYSGTPQFMWSAVWIPVVLLFFTRLWRAGFSRRGASAPLASAVFSGVAMGAAFLSGHHNIPIYSTVLMAGLWIWFLAAHWRERRAWMAAALFAIVAALVSAVQVLPAIEYGHQALRWAGAPDALRWNDRIPYSVHTEFSLHARSIPGMVIPGLSVHANPFVGIVAIALALAAIRICWHSREVRLMAAVALGGLLIALGADTPVHRIAYTIFPMVEKARYPAMAIVLSQVGIAALAALGLQALRAKGVPASGLWQAKPPAPPTTPTPAPAPAPAPASASASVPVPGGAGGFACARVPARHIAWWTAAFGVTILAIYAALELLNHSARDNPAWIVAVVALALAALLRWGRALPAAVLALFLVESFILPRAIQHRDPPGSLLKPFVDQADIADFLKKQPGWFRVLVDEDVVPYNFGDWHGIEQFGGYAASMPIRTHRMLGNQQTPRLFGIEYRIAKQPKPPWDVEVFQSRSGVKVYRAPGVREPLWAHHETCDGTDSLRIMSRDSGSMIVEANLACPGLLVAGDPWYSGWRAWVDGRRVRIQEYASVVRAVPVEAGIHRIDFRYRPGSVYWGAALTLFGLALAAGTAWWDQRVLPHTKPGSPLLPQP